MTFKNSCFTFKTLVFIAICIIVCSEGKTLSRTKRASVQDLHTRRKSDLVHDVRVAVIKGKVEEINSGEWKTKLGETVVMNKHRKRRRRHYKMVRDGNGGFRRAVQADSEGLKVEVKEHDPVIGSPTHKKGSEENRSEMFKQCMELFELIKELKLTLEYTCEFY